MYILFHLLFDDSYFKAMSIIAKLSFWILQPPENRKSIIAELPSFFISQPPENRKSIIAELSFEDVILDALDQFRTAGYVEKLKTNINPESFPSNKDDLLEFLYIQIAYT
jgi:hypothetical protein